MADHITKDDAKKVGGEILGRLRQKLAELIRDLDDRAKALNAVDDAERDFIDAVDDIPDAPCPDPE